MLPGPEIRLHGGYNGQPPRSLTLQVYHQRIGFRQHSSTFHSDHRAEKLQTERRLRPPPTRAVRGVVRGQSQHLQRRTVQHYGYENRGGFGRRHLER